MRYLAILLTYLCACADDTPADDTPRTEEDILRDAAVGDEPLIEPRENPECEGLDGTSAFPTALTLATDFFAICEHEEVLADVAFTWTAPSTGLYAFTLRSDFIWQVEADMELRRGDCTLTVAEGADSPPAEASACARHHQDENGTQPPLKIIAVEADETITVIVEGNAYHLETGKPQKLQLSAEPMTCPGAVLTDTLPIETQVGNGEDAEEIRRLSCSTAGYTRQGAIGWTAPVDGRYRFEIGTQDPDFGSLALGVIAEDCLGDELACDEGPEGSALTLDLQAQDEVVLILEVGDGGYESNSIALSVQME